MPNKFDHDFAGYDDWKLSGFDRGFSDNFSAPCAYIKANVIWNDMGVYMGVEFLECQIPWEDHEDEELIGHEFVMPEPEQRDY